MRELAMHLHDIVRNSLDAHATHIGINIHESERRNRLTFRIVDNGCGMSKEQLQSLLDPTHTGLHKTHGGLGIPMLKMHIQQTGGAIEVHSKIRYGTRVDYEFPLHHIDLQPMGDLAGTLALLMLSHPDVRFVITYRSDRGLYIISSRKLERKLGRPLRCTAAHLDAAIRLIESRLLPLRPDPSPTLPHD